MGMWDGIRGVVKRYSGTAGTVTVTVGGHVLSIQAHASTGAATVQIFNDASAIPIPNAANWFNYDPKHLSTTAQLNANTIVFTNTDSYIVEVAYPTGF